MFTNLDCHTARNFNNLIYIGKFHSIYFNSAHGDKLSSCSGTGNKTGLLNKV